MLMSSPGSRQWGCLGEKEVSIYREEVWWGGRCSVGRTAWSQGKPETAAMLRGHRGDVHIY
jgi:hypothetical protein